jgi:replicative DNA helicase
LGNNLCSPELEESVISVVLRDDLSFKILKDILNPNDFWYIGYNHIWECFHKLDSQGLKIDTITLEDELRRWGYLDSLTTFNGEHKDDLISYIKNKSGVQINNSETYAYKIKDDASKRMISETVNKTIGWINQGYETATILANIDEALGKIAIYGGTKSSNIQESAKVLEMAMKSTKEATGGAKKYIQTGIKYLDELIGGLFKQQLIIVAGRAGEGKSSLLLTMIMNAALENENPKKVGIFSLEMSNEEYMQRMIAYQSGISSLRLKMGKFYYGEEEKYDKAIEEIKKATIFMDDSASLTIPLLRSKIRKMVEKGAEIIFIDQLNLIQSNLFQDQEHVKINYMAYQAKIMAREFDVPVVVAHQMNRAIESAARKTDKDPKSSDLQQAGEAPPNIIIMITHKKEEDKIISSKLHVVKNRDGATGSIDVIFQGERTKFIDMEPDLLKDKEK